MPLDNAKTLVRLALLGHVTAGLAVILGYQATGSSALLALAIVALVVVAHHAVLLSGLSEAGDPADARHPFGHGRDLYFWSFVAGVLLFAHGAGVAIFEGIAKLKAPAFVSLGTMAQSMMFVALLLQAGIAYAWTTTRPSRDETETTLVDLRNPVRTVIAVENIAATIAVLVALAGVNAAEHSGVRMADAAAALALGFLMAAVAAFMSVQTKAILVGRAASPAVRTALRALVHTETGPGNPIAAVNDIRTLELGAGDLLVAADVRFRPGETAQSIAATTERLRQSVEAELPQVTNFFLAPAADPASPTPASAAPAPDATDHRTNTGTVPPGAPTGQPSHPGDRPHGGSRKKRRH